MLRSRQGEVLLAVRDDGQVRSACFTTDSTYRWLLSSAATAASRVAYQDLSLKLAAWLLQLRPPRPLTLFAHPLTALAGEPIIVTAGAGAAE
jgi:hypothetical protein